MVGKFTTHEQSEAPSAHDQRISDIYAACMVGGSGDFVRTVNQLVADLGIEVTAQNDALSVRVDDNSTTHVRAIAWHVKQAASIRGTQAGDTNPREPGHAKVSLTGELLEYDDNFAVHVRAATPDWKGKALPFRIVWSDELAQHGLVYGHSWVRVTALDNGYALTIRKDRRNTLLSRREQEIANLVADGNTFKQIAETLDIAISTVSTHLYRVYDKLGVKKRNELIQWMREHGGA